MRFKYICMIICMCICVCVLRFLFGVCVCGYMCFSIVVNPCYNFQVTTLNNIQSHCFMHNMLFVLFFVHFFVWMCYVYICKWHTFKLNLKRSNKIQVMMRTQNKRILNLYILIKFKSFKWWECSTNNKWMNKK